MKNNENTDKGTREHQDKGAELYNFCADLADNYYNKIEKILNSPDFSDENLINLGEMIKAKLLFEVKPYIDEGHEDQESLLTISILAGLEFRRVNEMLPDMAERILNIDTNTQQA